MNQQRVVDMLSLIQEVDPSAYDHLAHPKATTFTNKDLGDVAFTRHVRHMLAGALRSSETNALVTQMENYYRTNKYDATPANDEFSQFMKLKYPRSTAGLIQPGVKYHALKMDQQIYFGLFMVSKGAITIT